MEDRARKILIGCGIGCGTLLLLGVGSCVGFMIWINSPGEVIDPGHLLASDTTGYAEWTVRLEDPGTLAFVEGMMGKLDELQTRGRSPLPPALRDTLGQLQRKGTERDIRKLLPLVAAWTVRPGATPEEDLHLLTLSARGMSHQLIVADWIAGRFLGRSRDVDVVKHAGEKIYAIRDDDRGRAFAMFARRGVAFVTSDVETARLAIDRLDEDAGVRGQAGELERLFATLPEQALRGAVSNRRGEARRLARLLGNETDDLGAAFWDGLDGVGVSGAFSEELSVDGQLEFHGRSAGWAEQHAESVLEELRAFFRDSVVEVELTPSTLGNRITVGFRIVDLMDEVGDTLEKLDSN